MNGIALALLAFTSSVAVARADWQDTHWGMTPSEVAAVVPGASETSGADRKSNPLDGTALQRAPYVASGVPLAALFFFDPHNGLSAVTLITENVASGPQLLALLSSQYDPPISSDRHQEYGCQSVGMSWRDDRQRNTINLGGLWCAQRGVTSITYRGYVDPANTGL